MEIMTASKQWATRPSDERYASLEAMHAAALKSRRESREKNVSASRLLVVPQGDQLYLRGPEGGQALMAYRAFHQLSSRVGAPAAYLRGLPTELAAQCLQQGIRERGTDLGDLSLLFRVPGKSEGSQSDGLLLRALTSDSYTRIWNSDVIERLMDLGDDWTTPPARGDRPSGLYLGDRDMFAFMVNDARRIVDGSPEGLARGFFVANSEVGEAAFDLTSFLYRYICGNHIIWGAEKVSRVWVRHVGHANSRAFDGLKVAIRTYMDGAASLDEAKLKSAREKLHDATKDEVLDLIFG